MKNTKSGLSYTKLRPSPEAVRETICQNATGQEKCQEYADRLQDNSSSLRYGQD